MDDYNDRFKCLKVRILKLIEFLRHMRIVLCFTVAAKEEIMENSKLDQQLVYKLRALEMYDRQKLLDAQRQSNNRSLMVAAAGVIVLIGGAAATVAETPATSHVGYIVAAFGGLAEICGLFAFVKSSA